MAKTTWIGDVRAGAHDGSEIELKGWVHRSRGSNKIWFIVLRDSTGSVQCVIKRDEVGDAAVVQRMLDGAGPDGVAALVAGFREALDVEH